MKLKKSEVETISSLENIIRTKELELRAIKDGFHNYLNKLCKTHELDLTKTWKLHKGEFVEVVKELKEGE